MQIYCFGEDNVDWRFRSRPVYVFFILRKAARKNITVRKNILGKRLTPLQIVGHDATYSIHRFCLKQKGKLHD
jgi:hypothetical protein